MQREMRNDIQDISISHEMAATTQKYFACLSLTKGQRGLLINCLLELNLFLEIGVKTIERSIPNFRKCRVTLSSDVICRFAQKRAELAYNKQPLLSRVFWVRSQCRGTTGNVCLYSDPSASHKSQRLVETRRHPPAA